MQEYSTVVNAIKDFQQINFIRIIFIIAAAWLLIRLTEWLAFYLAKRLGGRFRLYLLPSVPVLRLFILILAVYFIVPLVVEPTFQNLVAILGATALAVGFAVKDYVSSLIAGIVVIYERPYRPGDWVQIDNAYGEVKHVGLRSMRMVTPDDTTVTIPHMKFWNTNIYNANDGRRDLQCIAHFYLNLQQESAAVRKKLNDVALTSPYLNHKRPVTVIVKEEPWGTHYQVKAYPIDGRDQFQFISDLTVRGKTALGEAGVQTALAGPALMAGDLQKARG